MHMITVADIEKMPQYQQNDLCAWVLELTRTVFSQPGAEEEYQKWLAERRSKTANSK